MILTAILGMAVLLVGFWMWQYMDQQVGCNYCAGTMRRHEEHCPFAGSGL